MRPAFGLSVVLFCTASLVMAAVQAAPEEGTTNSTLRGLETATQGANTLVVHDRLSGTGHLPAKHVVIEDVVAPGNSPGCISFGGDVTFQSTATLQIEIGGTTPCTDYDTITVANTLTLNNPVLQVRLISGYQPELGQRFDVLDWGALNGEFDTIDLSAAGLPAGLAWDTSQLYITGELSIGVPVGYAVPLPLYTGYLLAFLLGILAYRKRA